MDRSGIRNEGVSFFFDIALPWDDFSGKKPLPSDG